MYNIQDLIGNLFDYETIFCKALAKNDDSGRHGVLIPTYAYSMFPNFPNFDPLASLNYDYDITTIWQESSGTVWKDSSWRHYHRYPERRMTSLSPELLNEKDPDSIMVVCKEAGLYTYQCFVVAPSSPYYHMVGETFKLAKKQGLYEGSAMVPAMSLMNGLVNPALDTLIQWVEQFKQGGYVRTLRSGDTGVGYTFESLIGIDANSSKEPDYEGIEIKCSRSRQIKEKRRTTTGKQTLFTLIPNWGYLGNRRELVNQYGRIDHERNRIGLYCTIKVVPNSYDFHLEIDEDLQRVSVMEFGEEVVYYEFDRLREALENKHRESLFITAHARRGEDGIEEFLYDTAIYCNNVSFDGFLELIKENIIGLDFAIHTKDGKTRDHGFLWRLDNRKHLFRLFESVQEVV